MIDINNYINKVLVFYYPEKAGYWNSITKCCITEKPIELGKYYLDFTSKVDYPEQFSTAGIPLFNYGNQTNIEQPVVIAQYAIGLSSLLAEDNFNNPQLEKKFLNVSNWFVNNKEKVKKWNWLVYQNSSSTFWA